MRARLTSFAHRAAVFVFAGVFVFLLSCTGHCPPDSCPGWYDVGAVCTARHLCSTQDGPATCESDHIPYGAAFSCDVVTPGPSSRITIDVSSLWGELGTRNDFSAAPGQVTERDYPEKAAPWKVLFDGVDGACDCAIGGGCGCDNMPSTVHTITVETSTASEYVSLVFDDRECVHPFCER